MRLALAALAWVLLLPSADARGAVLIEMTVGTEPVRVVIDRPQQRVLITSGDRQTWFDLGAGLVYHRAGEGAAKRAHARYRPGHDRPPAYRIERFGPGPIVAGQASTYQVRVVDDRICAEMMLSAWMRPFVDPAIQAIALLEQLRGVQEADSCAGIPLATYAAAGWPLLAGKSDRPTLATRTIAFDYALGPDELTPPAA
ncbi:MAG: hypothetical protein ACREIR_18425, partial [Geminicoccaceae bacterium]